MVIKNRTQSAWRCSVLTGWDWAGQKWKPDAKYVVLFVVLPGEDRRYGNHYASTSDIPSLDCEVQAGRLDGLVVDFEADNPWNHNPWVHTRLMDETLPAKQRNVLDAQDSFPKEGTRYVYRYPGREFYMMLSRGPKDSRKNIDINVELCDSTRSG